MFQSRGRVETKEEEKRNKNQGNHERSWGKGARSMNQKQRRKQTFCFVERKKFLLRTLPDFSFLSSFPFFDKISIGIRAGFCPHISLLLFSFYLLAVYLLLSCPKVVRWFPKSTLILLLPVCAFCAICCSRACLKIGLLNRIVTPSSAPVECRCKNRKLISVRRWKSSKICDIRLSREFVHPAFRFSRRDKLIVATMLKKVSENAWSERLQ